MAERVMSVLLALVALTGCEAGSPAEVPAGNAEFGSAKVATSDPLVVPSNASGSEQRAPAAVSEADFPDFWARFRRAVLAGDAATITVLSARTVERRGDLDSSPTEQLRAAEVAPIIARMLDEVVPGIEADSTQRAEMEALALAPADAVNPAGAGSPASARVSDFEFTRGANGWRLTAFYFEPDE